MTQPLPTTVPDPSSVRKSWTRRVQDRFDGAAGRRLVIGVPYGFLILFFSLPFLVVLKLSVADSDGIRFDDLWTYANGVLSFKLRLSNYLFLLSDSLYANAYWSSIKLAALNTVICLGVGYPFAYFMARAPEARRGILVMLVSLPFWTSYLLRVYAWKGLLDEYGVINEALLALHLIDHPLRMMYTPFSVTIAMVYTYLPFMILPLYSNLAKMDMRLIEAAYDLGATPWQAFWRVTVPLSKAGIIAGAMLVFIPSLGEYVIPEMLGGPSTLMIGRVLWDEFFSNNDWSMAASVAVTMVLLILIPLIIFNRSQNEAEGAK